ncbi:MAG: MBL fold metallo-hydrolase [Alicyclobacillus sp.]|nr:MBL fold metallo-hydrolase [Alicyclobacillus sp.]
MQVAAFTVSPLLSNCYVLSESLTPGSPTVVIDPGDPTLDPVLDYIERHQLRVTEVWATHAHLDHVLGVDVIRQRFGVPAAVHAADLPVWREVPADAARWLGMQVEPLAEPDRLLQEGDRLRVGDTVFTVWHTPGHSPGGVVLVGAELAFTGDTLFAGTIGRVDLPHADPAAMQRSLARLLALPDELTLYPGHMGRTTMGEERRANPFLQNLSGPPSR